MADQPTRDSALSMLRDGASLTDVSRVTGIPRTTLHRLRTKELGPRLTTKRACPRCTPSTMPVESYVYLLGMYLGDGCLSAAPRSVVLRITCADDYPAIMQECEGAIRAASGRPVYRVQAQGCTQLSCSWTHWPCLFPQHGPGRKHQRSIVLAPWQSEMARAAPQMLLRGLIQSDGCRFENRVRRRWATGSGEYVYPRYMFVNLSLDIQTIFTDALDQLAISWRRNRYNSISIARREAVAALDAFVGPKT